MYVKVFLGMQQQIGLRGESFPLPEDTYYFFPFIGDRGGVTGEGVAGAFRVWFLDADLNTLFGIVMRPGQILPRIPPGTAHMVEASVETKTPGSWCFLKSYTVPRGDSLRGA
jgi:hypothetical protein